MRHVVHVVHSLEVGGTENGVVNLIGALAGEFRHTVVALATAGALAERLPPGVAIHTVGRRPGTDIPSLLRLTRLLRHLRPDIVHSRNWGALDAIPAARVARVPIVIHGEHGREVTDPHGLDRKRNRIRRLMAPLVTRFVTVSVDLRGWLMGTVGLRADKIVTIHNGVDVDRFSDEDRALGRRALGVDADTVVVGTVGRLDPVKDQLGLLMAFAAIAERHPHAQLVVVGDGPCRQALEALGARPDLAGRVRLLGERGDVATLLKGFDVYVLASIAEGISNTVLESMATSLPVVATRTGGNPELVDDGVTGTLVPVQDPAALSAALSAYIADGHLRALHGKAGRQRAVEAFSLPQMARGYGNLYRALTAARVA